MRRQVLHQLSKHQLAYIHVHASRMNWRKAPVSRIAEKEIERVKLFLVKNLPSTTMAKDERLALEIQILEL
jgi:hypothetical protein